MAPRPLKIRKNLIKLVVPALAVPPIKELPANLDTQTDTQKPRILFEVLVFLLVVLRWKCLRFCPCVRPCVRASVRAFWGGFWAPLSTGFCDLGLPEGFNFGLSEGWYGVVRLSGVGGGLLGCSHERFPSIWGSWKAALSPSEALPPAGSGLWGPCLGASPERSPLVWASGKPVLE